MGHYDDFIEEDYAERRRKIEKIIQKAEQFMEESK